MTKITLVKLFLFLFILVFCTLFVLVFGPSAVLIGFATITISYQIGIFSKVEEAEDE